MAENKNDAGPRLAITGRPRKCSVCRLEEHILSRLRTDGGAGGNVHRFKALSLYILRTIHCEDSDPEDSELEE